MLQEMAGCEIQEMTNGFLKFRDAKIKKLNFHSSKKKYRCNGCKHQKNNCI